MTWTATKSWPTGTVVTEADMDAYLRDNLDYLKDELDRGAIPEGLDADKPASPGLGDSYLATDANTLYVCESAGVWTAIADSILSNVADSVIRDKLKNVDGSGSGVDADLLDNKEGSYYSHATHSYAATSTTGYVVDNTDTTTVLSLTAETYTGNLLVSVSLPNCFTDDTRVGRFSLYVDSSSIVIFDDKINLSAGSAVIAATRLVTGLSAGSHTVKCNVYAYGGGPTYVNYPDGTATMSLTAIEV